MAVELLTDNKMPFFPAYTDHGLLHIEAILEAAERLIPPEVWEVDLLEPRDAAELVCATCLHDLALHMREHGFLQMVADGSRYEPLPWFGEDHQGRPADRPWSELWQQFRREAQQFTKSDLERLLGASATDVPAVAFGDKDRRPEEWRSGDHLLIGEFIRRHHARIAHEIAMYGFPGANEDEFPTLSTLLPELADPIGVTARSHNESLRAISAYLTRHEEDTSLADDARLYLMGLLRTADFFQLQPDRASPLLLHLREPQSPESVAEWHKHQAIRQIVWEHDDPQAVFFEVSDSHSLRTHLQLSELIADLQRELDVTTAILHEAYGGTQRAQFELSRQRVHTNLTDPQLQAQLGYVPEKAALRGSEDLFRLAVGALYGNHPAVAGRELLQNAVDAVRELRHWEAWKGKALDRSRWRPLPTDVLVEVRELPDGGGVFRIADRGIGMTARTVIDCFLTAGATFRNARVAKGGDDPAIGVQWMKSGKFGVGAFAAFLLGPEMRVATRHVESDKGLVFSARLDEDLIQLNWADGVPLGTEITIPFSASRLPRDSSQSDKEQLASGFELLIGQVASYYALAEPAITYRLVTKDGQVRERQLRGNVPEPGSQLPDDWRAAATREFDAVLWRLPLNSRGDRRSRSRSDFSGRVIHNGIAVRAVDDVGPTAAYAWSDRSARGAISQPSLAVFDTRHLLGLSLNRYALVDEFLPFEDELLESIGKDIVAYALAAPGAIHPLARDPYLLPVLGQLRWVPLLPALLQRYFDGDLCVLWMGKFDGAGELARRFTDARRVDNDWSSFPYRLALGVENVGYVVNEERREWGFSAGDLLARAANLVPMLRRKLMAGIVVRRPVIRDAAVYPSRQQHWRWDTDERFEDVQVLRLSPENDRDPRLEEAITRAATSLMADDPSFAIALTVYRKHDREVDLATEPLSLPWMRLLGAGLERRADAHRETARKVTSKDPELRAAVQRWRRLLGSRENRR